MCEITYCCIKTLLNWCEGNIRNKERWINFAEWIFTSFFVVDILRSSYVSMYKEIKLYFYILHERLVQIQKGRYISLRIEHICVFEAHTVKS
jgi:hypothetical protein